MYGVSAGSSSGQSAPCSHEGTEVSVSQKVTQEGKRSVVMIECQDCGAFLGGAKASSTETAMVKAIREMAGRMSEDSHAGPPDVSIKPAWHDRPPEPGAYLLAASGKNARIIRVARPVASMDFSGFRFYGPIPPDTEKFGTVV